MILSNTVTIDNLLKDSTYSVPDYQRAYEWKTPEIEDFWDDLTDYLELKIKILLSSQYLVKKLVF